MCILCVVQRWSRCIATMLPWLVIPLILIWALSQLLPPNFRFEVTSPRLACVVVLLITLFWYEFLMPQLSVWRARRDARIREQRRNQALELQKLKKSATRKCRNCFTPYRDQNPGGGKFMCSYCGHISKRPVLDLPGCQNWQGDTVSVTRYWGSCGHGGDGRCLTEKSYSGVLVFGCRLMGSFFLKVRWVWRKVFRIGSTDGDSSDGNGKGLLNKRSENGGSFQESRGEKARRKAEEKRQARLEREMLEEEERKQREEVARLVVERRKLRDEISEAEKLRSRGQLSVDGERESRKERERRRRERRRDNKDKGSSKSNSDGEELEKRASRENDRKREFDRQKVMVDNLKTQTSDSSNGNKVAGAKTRYFDRMKGTLLSSSRGFSGASFFGRNAQTAGTVTKVSKPTTGFVDHGQNLGLKKDVVSAGNVSRRSSPNGDHRPVGTNLQPQTTTPKKSWHQLFTRSAAVSPEPYTNSITVGNLSYQLEARSSVDQKVSPNVANQLNFWQSSPRASYSSPTSFNGNLVSNVTTDAMLPHTRVSLPNVVEDAELFEDPCYDPDSLSLLGPVSDQLDNFPLDLGTEFIENSKLEGPNVFKNVPTSAEVCKPSPIQCPQSRLRVSEERQVAYTPKSQKMHASKCDENNAQGPGTWQMWGTPLARDELDLACGSASWSPFIQKSNQEDITRPLGFNTMLSQSATRCPESRILTPQNSSVGNFQIGGTFSPVASGSNGNDSWVHRSPFQSSSPVDGERHCLPHDLIDNIAQSEVKYSSPNTSVYVYPFERFTSNGWPKEEQTKHDMKGIVSSTFPVKSSSTSGLFSSGPDVQSVWSYNHQ